MLGIIGARRHLEAAGIAASPARAHFAGQQADQSQFGPLAGPERPHQLLPGMLEGWRNCIHGGKRQEAPLEITVRCKVLRSGSWVNWITYWILYTPENCRSQIEDFRLKARIPTARRQDSVFNLQPSI